MRILFLLVKIALFLLLLGFALKNLEAVTLRYFLGFEWRAPLVMVLLVFFGMVVALHRGALFRVEALFDRLSERSQLRLQIAYDLAGLGFAGLLAWQLLGLAMRSFDRGIVAPTILRTPLWLPQAAMALGDALGRHVVVEDRTGSWAMAGFIEHLADTGRRVTVLAPSGAPGWQVNIYSGFAWRQRLREAAVRLQGCSASLVSGEGLILTNHHCVVGCVQDLSDAQNDYVKNGWMPATREDEKQCPGQTAEILTDIVDVTDRVTGAGAGLEGAARSEERRVGKECRSRWSPYH